jgi:hypothetical protein
MDEHKHKHIHVKPLPAAVRKSAITWSRLESGHWRSISDLTLTLKQARRSIPTDAAASGFLIHIDEAQGKKAFRHFMNLLNRAVYGRNAVRRHCKRLRVIAVIERRAILENETFGRWHIHAAIEPPTHLTGAEFETLIRECWERTDWAYDEVLVRQNADRGWIDYMLKRGQKDGLEQWLDTIDLDSIYNPNC